MENTEPAWLVEGGPVIVHDYRSGASRQTIERLTKTQVVLADGRRFGRATRSKRGSTTWETSATLHAPDDPVMLANLASQRYGRIVSNTRHKVMLAWSRAPKGDLSAAHAAAIHLRDAIADLEGGSL